MISLHHGQRGFDGLHISDGSDAEEVICCGSGSGLAPRTQRAGAGKQQQQQQPACPFASDLPEPAGRSARAPQLPCCGGFSFSNRKKPARCKREATQDLVWCSDECRTSFVGIWSFLMAVGTDADRKVQEALFRSLAAWRVARPGSERAERLRELNWSLLAFGSAADAVWRQSIDQAAGAERSVWNLLFSPDNTRAMMDKIGAHRADMERAMQELLLRM
jgi:hypothetical protein